MRTSRPSFWLTTEAKQAILDLLSADGRAAAHPERQDLPRVAQPAHRTLQRFNVQRPAVGFQHANDRLVDPLYALKVRDIEDKSLSDRQRLREPHLQLADVFTAERPGKAGNGGLAGVGQTRHLRDGQLRRRRDIIENELRDALFGRREFHKAIGYAGNDID